MPAVPASAPDAPLSDTPARAACASCGAPLAGPYCHACGEKRLDRHDYAFGHWLEHAIDTATHLDLKVVRGAWSLLRRPGAMTADVLAGRRVAWPKPIQLFLVVNVLFFVVAGVFGARIFDTKLGTHISPTAQRYGALARAMVTERVAERGVSADAYAESFDAKGHTLAKSLVFLFVPLSTLPIWLLHAGTRRYMLEHVLVATHVVTGVLLLLVAVLVLLALSAVVGAAFGGTGITGDRASTLVFAAAFLPFVTGVFRRAYGDGWGVSAARAVGFCAAFVLVLLPLYRFLLFLATFALT